MNKIVIDGIIGSWDVSAKAVVEALDSFDGDVIVHINSVGGSVLDGITIFNALKAYQRGIITTQIVGVAASIASYIALAGDKTQAYDNATFMIHNAWLPATGDYRALRKAADISEGLSSLLAKTYAQTTKLPFESIKYLMDEESFYYGEEIKTAGFVQGIIDTQTPLSKTEALAVSLEKMKACHETLKSHTQPAHLEAVAAWLMLHQSASLKQKNQQQKREMQIQTLEQRMQR